MGLIYRCRLLELVDKFRQMYLEGANWDSFCGKNNNVKFIILILLCLLVSS